MEDYQLVRRRAKQETRNGGRASSPVSRQTGLRRPPNIAALYNQSKRNERDYTTKRRGRGLLDHGSATADFGDVRSEFQALVAAAGVYELSARAKVSLTGSDRVRWLNGMVTNNIRDLAPGQGVYAFLLNPQGHILGDLYAYNRGESLLVDTDQSQLEKILAVFDKYIIMDDVEVDRREAGSHWNRGTEVPGNAAGSRVSRCPTSGLCNLSQRPGSKLP